MTKNLDTCFNYLYDMDPNISPNKSCYNLLTFPNDKKLNIINSDTKYFKLFKGAKLTSVIYYKSGKLYYTNDLKQELKSKNNFTLTPIINGLPNNLCGLLHDTKNNFWHLFTIPGTSKPKTYGLENKILHLIAKIFNLPIELFYGFIHYLPKTTNYHYDFWPSWIALLSIKNPGIDREFIVNIALEKILNNDKKYLKFCKNVLNLA